jgi:hypothetical protein
MIESSRAGPEDSSEVKPADGKLQLPERKKAYAGQQNIKRRDRDI